MFGLPLTPEGRWNMVLRNKKLKSEIAVPAARREFSIRFPGENT
jgi:hypothetical protein